MQFYRKISFVEAEQLPNGDWTVTDGEQTWVVEEKAFNKYYNAISRNLLIAMLANIEHERWSRWQKHIHSMGIKNEDGSLIIPAELVKRWEKQINTSYYDLSEKEQISDIKQVMKYFTLLSVGENNAENPDISL